MINQKNISSYIQFLYREKYNKDAPKEIIDSWENLSDSHIGFHLQELYQQWELNDISIKVFEKSFLQISNKKSQKSFSLNPIIISIVALLGFVILLLLWNENGATNDDLSQSNIIQDQEWNSKSLNLPIQNKVRENSKQFVKNRILGIGNIQNEIIIIREEYKRINSLNLQKIDFPYINRCGVTNATISLYTQNGKVLKITDNGVGDDDKAYEKWSYEYYFKNEELIFAYEWARFFDIELEKKAIIESRAYFHSDFLIKKIEGNKTTYPQNEIIDKKDTRYLLSTIKSKAEIASIYKCRN